MPNKLKQSTMNNRTNISKANPLKANPIKENEAYIKQKHSSKKNINTNVYNGKTNYYITLLLVVICLIPMLVRMIIYKPHMSQFIWFSNAEKTYDMFLFYKQWTFIIVAGIMASIIIYKAVKEKKSISFPKIFIPLACYAGLSFLSAALSKYSYFSFSGSFEQFESVFALLGYCIVAYYAFLFVSSEHDLTVIIKFMIAAAIIMSVIGILQFTGNDFFSTKAGYNLIIPSQYRNGNSLTFNFGENRVYLTLYNPNYVGVYASLFIPLILSMIFFQKNSKLIIYSVIAVLGLIICVFGAQSLAGVIGLGVALISITIFMWRNLVKRLYITISIIILLIIGAFLLNNVTDGLFINKMSYTVKNSKTTLNISDMDTEDDRVSFVYKGNTMNVQYIDNGDKTVSFVAFDENNYEIPGYYDNSSNYYIINDEKFPGVAIGIDKELEGVFFIQIDGINYRFTNQAGDGTYYYVNAVNKLLKLKTAESAVFTGYEHFASNRGYIWSRTIPVLKNYFFLGSGPDTFAMAFPQMDYVNLLQMGFGTSILTKPHSLYLQIAVQTGILSLIAFLIFYGMYFVSSIRLYIRGRFSSYYAKVGVAIFISTISYMTTGLVNDSSITTAPIFWSLIGIGIAVNNKVKPLIKEEIDQIKAEKKSDKLDEVKAN
jgi:hypothetical protein